MYVYVCVCVCVCVCVIKLLLSETEQYISVSYTHLDVYKRQYDNRVETSDFTR